MDEGDVEIANGKKARPNGNSQGPNGRDLRQWACKGDHASLQSLKEYFLAEEAKSLSHCTAEFFTSNPGIEEQLILSWTNFIQAGDSTASAIIPAVASLLLKQCEKHQELSNYGKRIILKVLDESHIRNLYKNLANSKYFVLLPTCRLLVDMASYAGGSSVDAFSEFDFSLKSLNSILDVRRNKDNRAKLTLRKSIICFLLLMLEHGDANVKFSIINKQRTHIMALFKHLDLDDADLLAKVLVMLKIDVLNEPNITRTTKAGLFTEWLLQQLKPLLLRGEDVLYGHEKVPLREVAFDVLLSICTGQDYGPQKSTAAASCKKRHILVEARLQHFISTMSPSTSNFHQELILRILEANPNLIIKFTKDYKTSLEPKLSVGWLSQMGFFTRLIGLPFRPLAFPWRNSSSPSQDLIEHVLPHPFAKQIISKALQSDSSLVKYSASICLLGSLYKFREVLKFLDESDMVEGDVRYEVQDLYSQRIPELQTLAARYMIAKQPRLLKVTLASSLQLYQTLLPELTSATKLDVSALLMQSLNVKSKFSDLESEALMGLFDASDIQWLRQNNGGSFFSEILQRLIRTIDNAMFRRIENFMKTSVVFRENSVISPAHPILLALEGDFGFLPAEEATSLLLEFLDSCLCRCAQSPYKYIDSATERIDGRIETASPFFATICEQASIRFRRTDYAPSHHQTVIGWMFELGYFLALSGESEHIIKRLLGPFEPSGYSESLEESLSWLEKARESVRGGGEDVVGYLNDSQEIFELSLKTETKHTTFWLVTLLQRIRMDIKSSKSLKKVEKLFQTAASSPRISEVQNLFLDKGFWCDWYFESNWLDFSALFSDFIESVCIPSQNLDQFMHLVMERLPAALICNDLDGCIQPLLRCANSQYTANLLSKILGIPMTSEKVLRIFMQCTPILTYGKGHLGRLLHISSSWKDGTEPMLAQTIKNIPWDVWRAIRDEFENDSYVLRLHPTITEALFANSEFLKRNVASIHGVSNVSIAFFNTLFDFNVEKREGVLKWTGSEASKSFLAELAKDVRYELNDVSFLSRVYEVSLLQDFAPGLINFQQLNLLQKDACRLLRLSANTISRDVVVQCCTHIADQLTRYCVQEDDFTNMPGVDILGVFEQITIHSYWRFTDYVSEVNMDALLQASLRHFEQVQVLEATWVCILQLTADRLVHYTRLLQLILSNPKSILIQCNARLRYLETLIIGRLFEFDSKKHANANIMKQIMQKYGGTCCASDSVLCCILQKAEASRGKSLADFISAWDLDKDADGGFITAGPNGLRVRVDSKRLLHTLFHYPFQSSDAQNDEARNKLYDPFFVLPALCIILGQVSDVKIGKFVELHGFAYMVASLSHHEQAVRTMSQGMLNFCAHNLETYGRDRIPLTLLIGSLRSILSEGNGQLPLYLAIFFGLSSEVLLQPIHFMHQRLLQVFSKQSSHPTNALPLFFTLQNVNSSDFIAEMSWVLKILRTGYRKEDALAYHRMHAIQICMSMFRAPRLPRKLTDELRQTIKALTVGSMYGMRAYIRQDAAFPSQLVE